MSLPIFPTQIKPLPTTAAQPATGLPLLRLGFRPFYLGAAAYAAVAVPPGQAAVRCMLFAS